MGAKGPFPANWQEFITVEERNARNQWSMWGSTCIIKFKSRWNSMVPGLKPFKTKSAAYDALTDFVVDEIPERCRLRALAAKGGA